MTATLHQIPANRTSFDAHETLVALREIGVTEVDELLRHFHDRMQKPAADAGAQKHHGVQRHALDRSNRHQGYSRSTVDTACASASARSNHSSLYCPSGVDPFPRTP